MAAKDKPKPTKKKAYKKPTADKLNEKDLNRVTGGSEEPEGWPFRCRVGVGAVTCWPEGLAVAVGNCKPSGGAATIECLFGGAAASGCIFGGAARSCGEGSSAKK
jgi:hypothetical protein